MTTYKPGDLLRIEQVAERIGVPENTLRFWRQKNIGPKSAKLGRRVVYRASDVEAWIDAQFDGATPNHLIDAVVAHAPGIPPEPPLYSVVTDRIGVVWTRADRDDSVLGVWYSGISSAPWTELNEQWGPLTVRAEGDNA